MNFKVQTVDLIKALQAAVAAAAHSAGGLVEIASTKRAVSVRGTDGELFVHRRVPAAKVLEGGSAAVSGRELLGVLHESGAAEAEIHRAEDKLLVACGAGQYELLCAVGTSLPEAPAAVDEGEKIDGGVLGRLFELTRGAASAREMRYAMNGVCLTIKRGLLVAAATDGRRLAVARARAQRLFKGEIIVPLRAVGEICRQLADLEGDVALRVAGNFLVVDDEQGQVATRLVEGRFPAYEDVIPKDNPITAQIPAAELARAMKVAPFLSSEEQRAVRLSFGATLLTIEFGSAQRGHGKVEIPVTCSGGKVTVALNPAFVLDVLRVTTGDTVEVALRDADTAVVFRQGDELVYVLMPISPGEADVPA